MPYTAFMSDASQVTTRRVRDVCVVELPGSFTSESSQSFNEKVEWALADTPGGVVVDFSAVQSADSGGVNALKFLFERSREVDIPVVFSGVSAATRTLLEQGGYLKSAQVATNVDEAVEMI